MLVSLPLVVLDVHVSEVPAPSRVSTSGADKSRMRVVVNLNDRGIGPTCCSSTSEASGFIRALLMQCRSAVVSETADGNQQLEVVARVNDQSNQSPLTCRVHHNC